MAMFQQPLRPNGLVHVEFKAGRMEWDGKKVTADKRKGKVVLYTAEEEQLTHFQWIDREKNDIVLDLIVINDAYFEKIEKVKDGRVYILRFTSSDKKLFFWMQEPKEEKDEDNIKKFNQAVGAQIPDKKSGGAAASGGAGNGGAIAAAAAMNPEFNAILQQFLQSQGQAASRAPPLPMAAVLTPEVLTGLATDEAAVAEMQSHLPESHRTPESVREALASPQLQQTLRALTQAVHSDQLPLLFASLELDTSSIANAPPGTDAFELLCKAHTESRVACRREMLPVALRRLLGVVDAGRILRGHGAEVQEVSGPGRRTDAPTLRRLRSAERGKDARARARACASMLARWQSGRARCPVGRGLRPKFGQRRM